MAAISLPRFAGMVVIVSSCASFLHGETPEAPPEEAVLKDAGIATDGPALLDFFRKRTLSDEDQAALAEKVQRLGDASFPVRTRASRELIAAGRPALVYLRAALKDDDPERKRRAEQCVLAIEGGSDLATTFAAARLLASHRPEGTAEALLGYLPLVDDEVLEEEILTTLRAVGTSAGKADESLVAALKDRVPARRAAAAYVLGRLPASARPRVEPLLEDIDARVRFRAAQGLLAGKNKEAVPVFVALLGKGPEPLAYAAEEVLGRIAGEQSPQAWLGAGTAGERQKCREAWETWWKAAGTDLADDALDVEQRQLGYTLICCCDGYNAGKGKVWEVDARGKTRWEINVANYPVDAVSVPGNRVLIAEQGGMCLTERDTQGKVLWKHEVRENLVSCQRLPNGNTFLATYSQVSEVTREHKEVFTYPSAHGTIYSAAKLRNGHVAYLGSNNVLAELDEKGKEIKALKVDASGAGLFKFDPLTGGRYLVGQNTLRKVVEFDATGKAVWDCPFANANSVERLPNGNILVCSWSEKRVVEMTRAGKTQWELKLEGGPLRIQRR